MLLILATLISAATAQIVNPSIFCLTFTSFCPSACSIAGFGLNATVNACVPNNTTVIGVDAQCVCAATSDVTDKVFSLLGVSVGIDIPVSETPLPSPTVDSMTPPPTDVAATTVDSITPSPTDVASSTVDSMTPSPTDVASSTVASVTPSPTDVATATVATTAILSPSPVISPVVVYTPVFVPAPIAAPTSSTPSPTPEPKKIKEEVQCTYTVLSLLNTPPNFAKMISISVPLNITSPVTGWKLKSALPSGTNITNVIGGTFDIKKEVRVGKKALKQPEVEIKGNGTDGIIYPGGIKAVQIYFSTFGNVSVILEQFKLECEAEHF